MNQKVARKFSKLKLHMITNKKNSRKHLQYKVVWRHTHPKYNNCIAWFCGRYLYTFPCLDLLFCGDALYATYQFYRKEVLEDNCRTQVDIVTRAWHCVSTCFLIIHLLHLSNNLWPYRNKQVTIKIINHQIDIQN